MEAKNFKLAPQILQETISGEVVIINMATGSYYSLTETGAEVWDMLERGYSSRYIHQSLTQKYKASETLLQSAVTDFVTQLQAEGLIVSTELEQARSEAICSPEISTHTETKALFIAPTLHKYDDMQELLLVDPIHDVDESGWPNLKQAA